MRDPNRIDGVLKAISEIWHKNPDMRLGQLIGNVLEGPSLYYVEDDGLVSALKDVYDGARESVDFDNDSYVFDLIKKYPFELVFVLESDTYDEYLKTYETVPDEKPALEENEFTALHSYFVALKKDEADKETKDDNQGE